MAAERDEQGEASALQQQSQCLLLDLAASAVWLAIYFAFGYIVGEPAVAVLEAYAKVANYVAIGLVVAIFVMTFVRGSRKAKTES